MKCTFLVDDEGVIWLHYVEKLMTRIKFDYTEARLPNGTSYCFNQETRLCDQLSKDKLGNNSRNREYYYEDIFAHLQSMSQDRKTIHQGKIDSLANEMYQNFKDMKVETNILEDMEEAEDNTETNNAIKELYPDLNITINDILNNENAYQILKPPSTSENLRTISTTAHSKSVMGSYGDRSIIK